MTFLRYWNFADDAVDDGIGADVFGFGFVGEEDAVAQDVVGHVLHVLWGEEGAAVHEGEGAGGEGAVDGAAG